MNKTRKKCHEYTNEQDRTLVPQIKQGRKATNAQMNEILTSRLSVKLNIRFFIFIRAFVAFL